MYCNIVRISEIVRKLFLDFRLKELNSKNRFLTVSTDMCTIVLYAVSIIKEMFINRRLVHFLIIMLSKQTIYKEEFFCTFYS